MPYYPPGQYGTRQPVTPRSLLQPLDVFGGMQQQAPMQEPNYGMAPEPMAQDPQWLELARRALEEAQYSEEQMPGIPSAEELDAMRNTTNISAGLMDLGSIIGGGDRQMSAQLRGMAQESRGRQDQMEAQARQEMMRRQGMQQENASQRADLEMRAGLGMEQVQGRRDVADTNAEARVAAAAVRQEKMAVDTELQRLRATLATETNALRREEIAARIQALTQKSAELGRKNELLSQEVERKTLNDLMDLAGSRSMQFSPLRDIILRKIFEIHPLLKGMDLEGVGETMPSPGGGAGPGDPTDELQDPEVQQIMSALVQSKIPQEKIDAVIEQGRRTGSIKMALQGYWLELNPQTE